MTKLKRNKDIPVHCRDRIEHVEGYTCRDDERVVVYREVDNGKNWTLAVLTNSDIRDGIGALAVTYAKRRKDLMELAGATCEALKSVPESADVSRIADALKPLHPAYKAMRYGR